MRLLLLASLTLALGTVPGWADQQAPTPPPGSVRAAQASRQRRAAGDIPANSSRIASQRKGRSTTSQRSSMAEGKRDPFKLPVVPTARGNSEGIVDSAPGGALPPGVRGLLISQLRLEGVVREQTANKMIAVVTNETRRAYFLTENESVYNGVVSKITPDAVYFKENVLDKNGRVTTREVMKQLSSAPGEGR